MDFLIYYMIVGYAINNIIGLLALYGEDQYVELDMGSFLLTIPIWPYTLYRVIQAQFSGDE